MKRTLPKTTLALAGFLTLAACGGTPAPRAEPSFVTSTDRVPTVSANASTAQPPWPAPEDVLPRVSEAGLNLGQMGMADHYHATLQIVVNGSSVPVPANIGVDASSGAMSSLHTHETDGTVHIEAQTDGQIFTLGQLFTEWGVRLTRTQIGGVQTGDSRPLVVTSDGRRVEGDPRDLRFQSDQRIVIQTP